MSTSFQALAVSLRSWEMQRQSRAPSLRALNSLGQGEAPEAQLSKFPRFFFLLKSQPGAELS